MDALSCLMSTNYKSLVFLLSVYLIVNAKEVWICDIIGKRVLLTENSPKSGLMGERKRSGVIQWNKCEILVIQNNGMN